MCTNKFRCDFFVLSVQEGVGITSHYRASRLSVKVAGLVNMRLDLILFRASTFLYKAFPLWASRL
jgi:hypothetical protein